MIAYTEQLKENTELPDPYFAINVFHLHDNSLYMHWHEGIEIIYFLGGSAVFHIGGAELTASPGDILFVNSGLLHSACSAGETLLDFYAIVFNRDLLADPALDPYYSWYIEPYAAGSARFPTRIAPEGDGYRRCREQIERIIDEFDAKRPAYQIAIRAQLLMILVEVCRDEGRAAGTERPAYAPRTEMFKKLTAYIAANYGREITVSEAAEVACLSPGHFCKTFKRFTGRTFIEYLNLYRVGRAETLIRNTSLSVGEIAEAVGFCNVNYFDRVYRKYKRRSPSEARRRSPAQTHAVTAATGVSACHQTPRGV